MDFNLKKEQEAFRQEIEAFVQKEIAPYELDWDAKAAIPEDIFTKLGDARIFGVFVPKEYGGEGLGHMERVLAMEEVGKYSPSVGLLINSQHLTITALMNFGTEEQKKKYLPGLCAGTIKGNLATTEPQSGSDFGGQRSTADFVDGMWVINGTKNMIVNFDVAELSIVTAKTGVKENGKSKFSAFLIEEGTPGFTSGKRDNMTGLKGARVGDMYFENVKVAPEMMLGQDGQGAAVAMNAIAEVGRAGMSAVCTGVIKRALEMSIEYAKNRIVYGKPISKLQAIQIHIANMRVDYEAARLLVHRGAFKKDEGTIGADFSIAKLFAIEGATRASKSAIDILGGYGVIAEYGAEKMLRDVLTAVTGGGTNEIQRVIIAGDTLK